MKKTIYQLVFAGALAFAGYVQAQSLSAELIMPGGRSWQGMVVSRDGDWINFDTGTGNPIRVGASTIEELRFNVALSSEKISTMMRNRENVALIKLLEKTLFPYEDYNDIPSNLSRYNALLMELYYNAEQYSDTLSISRKLARDDRNPKIQDKARVYYALSLIETGQSEGAVAVMKEYGWDNLNETSPAAQLYVTAKFMALSGNHAMAMELAAKIVALHSQDPDWLQPAELLCAELYTELGMYDSAEEVINQIALLYKDSNENDKAQELKKKIIELRAKEKMKKLKKSEDA